MSFQYDADRPDVVGPGLFHYNKGRYSRPIPLNAQRDLHENYYVDHFDVKTAIVIIWIIFVVVIAIIATIYNVELPKIVITLLNLTIITIISIKWPPKATKIELIATTIFYYIVISLPLAFDVDSGEFFTNALVVASLIPGLLLMFKFGFNIGTLRYSLALLPTAIIYYYLSLPKSHDFTCFD